MNNKFELKVIYRLFVIMLIFLTYPLLVEYIDNKQRMIITDISKSINKDIYIGKAKLTWMNGPSLSVHDIIIKPNNKTIVAAKEGNISLSNIGVGKIKINNITLKKVMIAGVENGKNWKLKLDDLSGSLSYINGSISLRSLQANLYGGSVQSKNIKISKNGKCSANVTAKNINITKALADLFGSNQGLKSAAMDSLSLAIKLDDGLSMKGKLKLSNIDLYDTASSNSIFSLIHGKLNSENIKMDNISMDIDYKNKDIKLSKITAVNDSYSLKASLDIHDSKLNGRMSTSSYGGVGGVKVNILGTLSRPIVTPAASTLIGAGLGAVVGGPIGAAVGAKALGFIEDIVTF